MSGVDSKDDIDSNQGELPEVKVLTNPDGSLNSVEMEGKTLKIHDEEAQQKIREFGKEWQEVGPNEGTKIQDTWGILRELTARGYVSAFTIPRQHIKEKLKWGLSPRPDDQRAYLTAGTIGVKPFQPGMEEPRYIAVVKSPEIMQRRHIQPRFTGARPSMPTFWGTVVTERGIPLSELIIIDSKDMSVIYPEAKTVVEEAKTSLDQPQPAQSTSAQIEAALTGVELKMTREELDQAFEAYTPPKLIQVLSREFPKAFESMVGDGETLAIHTKNVLEQYEKHFSRFDLPDIIEKDTFRLILALHDIGKPQAIAQGDASQQHKYNASIARDVLTQLGYSEKEVKIAEALLKADPIGDLLKGRPSGQEARIEKCKNEVIQLAAEAGVDAAELFDTFEIMYKSDACSHTRYAGSRGGLDSLFETDLQGQNLDLKMEYLDSIDETRFEIMDARRAA